MSRVGPQALLQQLPRLIAEQYADGTAAARQQAVRDLWSIVNARPLDTVLDKAFAKLAATWSDGGVAALEDLLTAGERLQVLSPGVSRSLRHALPEMPRGEMGGLPPPDFGRDILDGVAGAYARCLPGLWAAMRASKTDTVVTGHQANAFVSDRYGAISVALRNPGDGTAGIDGADLLWIAALASWDTRGLCFDVDHAALGQWSVPTDAGAIIDHDPLLRLPAPALLFRADGFALDHVGLDGWLAWNDEDGPDGGRMLCVLPVLDGATHRTAPLCVPLAPGWRRDVIEEFVEHAAAGEGVPLFSVSKVPVGGPLI